MAIWKAAAFSDRECFVNRSVRTGIPFFRFTSLCIPADTHTINESVLYVICYQLKGTPGSPNRVVLDSSDAEDVAISMSEDPNNFKNTSTGDDENLFRRSPEREKWFNSKSQISGN